MLAALRRPLIAARPPARGLAAALALAALAAPARAEQEREPVRLVYAAAPGCASRDEFVERLRAYTSRIELADEQDARARRFDVVIEPDRDGYRGRLTVEDPAGRAAAREVRGATCSEVTLALALVVALAVDPNASLEPAPVAPDAAGTPAPPAPRADPRPAGSAEPAPAAPAPPPPSRAASRRATARPSGAANGGAPALAVGATAAVRSALQRAAAPTFGVEVELRASRAETAPRLRLSAEGMPPASISGPRVGGVRLAWLGGALAGCPLVEALGGGWTAGPCATLSLGAGRAGGEHGGAAR
ncbi:MAG: hypothetical protein OZ921_11510, partial [Sorangiineae bacterium]|nr:hypothetical protein [Sorangiineae bacterium]